MTRNLDLETFYSRITKQLNLVGEYLHDKNLIKLFKACRLKPYSIFTEKFTAHVKFENHWVDEFGHSVKLKNNQIEVILEDTEIKNTQTITDLFYGQSLNQIGENSQLVSFNKGDDIYLLSFFGQDEYLRTFIINDGEIKRISSLIMGTENLSEIIKNSHNKTTRSINKNLLFDWKNKSSIGLDWKKITGDNL